MSASERFLIAMAIIFTVPYLVWRLGRTDYFAPLVVVQIIASVTGKLVGIRLAGMALKWPPGESAIIGWLLQTKALIMIIFANILLDRQIITAETFTALLLMAVGSTMLTVPMVAPLLHRLRGVVLRTA